jgi:phospholipase C
MAKQLGLSAVAYLALAALFGCQSTEDSDPSSSATATTGVGGASSGGGGMGSGGMGGHAVDPCPQGQARCDGVCVDATTDDRCGTCTTACTGAEHCVEGVCAPSKIEHVVLIVQENHTFDAYFGRYCTAPSGSNPSCTKGRACCERAPDVEASGAMPMLLDDASNFASDRDHRQACEVQQLNGGKMDQFVTGSSGSDTCLGSGPSCSNPKNWALADETSASFYWALADGSALADRYFQPIAGGSSSNDMYFATSAFQFVDNDYAPDVMGNGCSDVTGLCIDGTPVTYSSRTTIGDLLLEAGKSFAVYAGGYADAKAAAPSCATPKSDCPYHNCLEHPVACRACIYDPSDIPFAYYDQFADGLYFEDYADLKADLEANTLPNFAFVKARAFENEHPNVSTLSAGAEFVDQTLQAINASSYAKSTLVLVTWDEGGGFFDHVAPPASIDTDDHGKPVPYGTRVPLIAVGPFARKGTVSHVPMEHSSIVRFLEYNFVGGVGQLSGNDAKVHNLGSLLDPKATGVVIPE